MNIRKREITNRAARNTSVTQLQGVEFFTEALSQLKRSLVMGHRIELRGFGQFEIAHRAARKGRLPSGRIIKIPAKKTIRFTPSKKWVELLNQAA